MLLLLCYVDPLGVIVWSCALCGSAPLSVSAAYYCVMVNMAPATDRTTGPLLEDAGTSSSIRFLKEPFCDRKFPRKL